MEALDDGGGVDEVSSTQDADEVGVELRDLYPGGPMHDDRANDGPAGFKFSVILSTVYNKNSRYCEQGFILFHDSSVETRHFTEADKTRMNFPFKLITDQLCHKELETTFHPFS